MAIRDKLDTNKYYGVVHAPPSNAVYSIASIKIYCKPKDVNEMVRKLREIDINVSRGNEL